MSVESISLVLNHSRAQGTDKLVLLGIANHDGDGGSWPSVATLARYANRSESAVIRALRRLEESGELRTHRNGGGTHRTRSDRRPNRYEIVISTGGRDGVARAPGREHSRGGVCDVHGVAPALPEPSLEPSSIELVESSTAVAPISLDAYFKLHPEANPRVSRWRHAG